MSGGAAGAARLRGARLYLITGERRGPDLDRALGRALDAIPPGGAAVQVRAKDLPTRPLLELARRAVGIARPRGAAVFVNDRLDVALAAGADGVHLPERGVREADVRAAAGAIPLLVGRSTHSPDDALAAGRAGADVVALGPIFETPSKRALGHAPLGPGALQRAREALAAAGGSARLFAIGGITGEGEAARARAAGADGIACIRGVLDDGDPAGAAAALWRAAADISG